MSQVPENAEDIAPLLIGEKIPDVVVTSLQGEDILFADVLNGEKAVLLFYRGGWCPFCNRHLAAIGQIENEIIDNGYKILAFSPDSPKSLTATMDKEQLSYTLYSDATGNLMKSMGIAFRGPERYREKLGKYSGGKNSDLLLPVPSVFIVDGDGIILFEYINPNYRQRMGSELLLAVLSNLQSSDQ